MPRAYRCRRCHGTPVPQPPEDGKCEHCGGFYRHEVTHVRDGEVDGAEIQPMKEGEPISAADLLANLEDDETMQKRQTGMAGLDWVFDGGLPYFGAILLCAKAGTGKSTFLWEMLRWLAKKKVSTLYISSEQSLKDLGRQFARLGSVPAKYMTVHAETDRDGIISAIEKCEPEILVLDSLHEVEGVTDESGYDMASGGPNAVTRVAKEIRRLSTELEFLAFLVGHMNNDGTMAGGSHLRHAVDATLVLRPGEDEKDPRRILEFEGKTRFGPRGRRGLFMMGEKSMKDCGPLKEEGERIAVEEPKAASPKGRKKVVLN